MKSIVDDWDVDVCFQFMTSDLGLHESAWPNRSFPVHCALHINACSREEFMIGLGELVKLSKRHGLFTLTSLGMTSSVDK
jgi:hypothetical protein